MHRHLIRGASREEAAVFVWMHRRSLEYGTRHMGHGNWDGLYSQALFRFGI